MHQQSIQIQKLFIFLTKDTMFTLTIRHLKISYICGRLKPKLGLACLIGLQQPHRVYCMLYNVSYKSMSLVGNYVRRMQCLHCLHRLPIIKDWVVHPLYYCLAMFVGCLSLSNSSLSFCFSLCILLLWAYIIYENKTFIDLQFQSYLLIAAC